MTSMLNKVNIVHDNKAEYLRDIERSGLRHRRMDIYISHNDMMLAIGYEDGNLIWLSHTPLSDLFLSRRVFECMKEGEFYRRVKLRDVFNIVGMHERDLQTMCHVGLDNIQSEKPVFSGCITGSGSSNKLTGIEFASIIAVLPKRLRDMIPNIGSEDEILSELEKDSQCLDELYHPGSKLDVIAKRKVDDIRSKWLNADCLKLADRAIIRTLYRKVCNFEENVIKIDDNNHQIDTEVSESSQN